MPFLAPAIPLVAGAVMGGGGEPGDDDAAQQKIWDADAAAKRDRDFQWGGREGGAQADSDRLRLLAANANNQPWTKTDYGLGDQSRGSQLDALQMMQGAAMGNAPSQAAIMMRQGNDQAVANQMGMAAGARGPAAMAMAQQQAMGNASNMSTNNMNNMGALRAQEMAQARGAYMGGASGMRGQDDSRSQFGSDLELRRRALQQQGSLAYEGMSMGVNQAQLGARGAQQGASDAAFANSQRINQQSRANDTANVNAAVNAFGTVMDASKKAA